MIFKADKKFSQDVSWSSNSQLRKIVLLLFIFCLFSFTMFAADRTWTGNTNTSWNVASNWAGNAIPSNNDNALIPGGRPNYPVITSNITVRNITINNTGTGGRMTVNSGTVNARRFNLRATGIFTITGGQINFTRMTIAGTINQSGGNITATSTSSVNSGGIVNQSGGVLHMGNNVNSSPSANFRVNAGGVVNQSGGTISVRDLAAGSGVYNQTGATAVFRIDRNWLMGNGSTFNSTNGTVRFSGNGGSSNFSTGTRQFFNILIDNNVNPGFSNSNGSTIPIAGNFSNNNNSLNNSNRSTFTFNGTGNQTIVSSSNGTNSTFGNFVVNKPSGILFLQSNIYIAADMTVNLGTFDMDAYRCNRATNGGTLLVNNNAFLLLSGLTGGQTGSNFPTGFSGIGLDTASTVVYDGGNQTVANMYYGNLVLSAATGNVFKTMPSAALFVDGSFTATRGTASSLAFTALSNFTIAGNVTIGVSTTFNTGTFTHSVGGDFINSGILNATGNRIILNGPGVQQVSSTSNFFKLVVNKTTGYVNLGSNISLNDSLVFTRGNIRTGAFKVIITVNGKIGGAAQTTGWVFGTLEMIFPTGINLTKTFMIGDSLRYAPAVLNPATITTSGAVNARVTSGDHPLISSSTLNSIRSVNKYWTFSNAGMVFNNCRITFNWQAADIDPGSSTALFKVSRYTSVWDTMAVTSPLATSIQATGITAFGAFAVGERCLASVIGTWTGGASTVWADPMNWQCGILPTTTINILVPTGLPRYPQLTVGTGAVRNVTIQPGASVTVSGTGILQISGTISNAGTFNVTSGAIELNGTTTQTIPANVFSGNQIRNLTTNNPAGVNLSGTLSVNGILKANVGNFNTGTFLTLLSTATQTALIDGSGAGNVLGTVNIQRYLASGYGYKYVSSPVTTATVNQFADDLNLAAAFPTFYRYIENVNSSGWDSYTAAGGALVPFTGYAANFGNSTAPKTIDIAGTVANGLRTINLQNNNQPFTKGFNLVGNPYPSPLNWDAATGWTKTNIDNAIYYFDAGALNQYSGTYSSYINGISSNGVAGNIIPAMQGFFVHVTNGTFPVNGVLSVNNAARTTTLNPFYHRVASNEGRSLIRMEAKYSDAGGVWDAVTIYFDDGATAGFNMETDALKLMNTDENIPNIYSHAADNVLLSINAMPGTPGEVAVIPVGVITQRSGWLTFNASEILNVDDSLNVYFYDAEKRMNYNLRDKPECKIYLDKGTYNSRFSIRFSTEELPFVTDTDQFGVYGYGNTTYIYHKLKDGETGELTVTNLQGQLLHKEYLKGSGSKEIRLNNGAGIYVVTLRSSSGVFSKKLFLNGE